MRPGRTHLDQERESQQLLADGGREERLTTQEGNIDDEEYLGVEIPDTAHLISKDSWLQVSLVLITGVNAAGVLAYSGTVMVHVGWIVGVVGFILATALSFYANSLLANLHEFGGKRHIRFRDLAAHIYGREGYFTIWALQYVELFMINIGFIILAGYALKAVYVLFEGENGMKLSYCNLTAGFVCFMLAILIPHLSAMRVWLGLSSVLTILYITVAIALSIKDGAKASAQDYSIPGTTAGRIFEAIGSVAIMFMSPNTGMLPEIQATIREPVVSNMMKALYLQFTVGALPMFAVTFVGYWAYGSSTSTYLLDNTTGPVWVKALANISAFLQSVISFHIYASPTYEYMDTKCGVRGSPLAIRNLSLRLGLRGSYLLISSLLAALLPFLGDFLSLTGAFCIVPLTFVIPHHMYLVVKKNRLYAMQKLWHWLNVFVFACWSIAATVAATRLIVVDSKTYDLFGS